MARQRKWPGGYRDRKSGIFYIRRDIAGATYHQTTRCKTLDGAIAELARFERDPQNYIPGGGSKTDERHTFDSAVPGWLEYSSAVKGNSQKHVNSQAAYFDTWARFLEQRSVTLLEQFSEGLVDDYIAWRRSGAATAKDGKPGKAVGPHTIALEVAAIKVLFSWACRPGGCLLKNPLERYKLPKRPRRSSRPKVFEGGMEWWEKVRPHLSLRWQLAGDVLLGSAMRYSSLRRLRPDDVDLGRDTVHLAGNLIKGKDGVTLPVSHRVAQAAKAVAMHGLPPTSSDMNHALEKACVKAGVTYFSVHSFRHTSASLAIEDGVTGKQLQARLAHASFATTEGYVWALGQADGAYRGRI
jgi:integrase